MVETGNYNVNKSRKKDVSFKSFICALLAFLAMLILISLLLLAFRNKGSSPPSDTSKNNTTGADYLKGNKLKQEKEYVTTTTRNKFDKIVQGPTIPSALEISSTTEVTTNIPETSSITIKPFLRTTKKPIQTTVETTTEILETTISTTTETLETTKPTKKIILKPTEPTTTETSGSTLPPTTEAQSALLTSTETVGSSTQIPTSKPVETTTRNGSTFIPTTVSLHPTKEPTTVKTTTGKQPSTEPSTTPTITTEMTNNTEEYDLRLSGEYQITTLKPTVGTTTTTTTTTSTSITSTKSIKIIQALVPSTCKEGVCKRAASSMLAMMNHESDRCNDYYKFICNGSEPIDQQGFFHSSFRGVIKKLKEVTTTSEKYLQTFADFYNSCNQFSKSVNRIERLKSLKGTEGASLTDTIITSVLTQTMPFFDIGLNIKGKNYVLEITLPALSYLKTNLKGWSLTNQLKEDCLSERREKISQNIIELNRVVVDIKTCIEEKTNKYINDFLKEIKDLKTIHEYEFLEENEKAAAQINDLIEILNVVQDGLEAYRNDANFSKFKETTLKDLKSKFDFGIDWIELFKGITGNTFDENSIIYMSEHVEDIFKKIKEKQANLQVMLNLWYNIELYKNIVLEKQIDNIGYYCLDLTSQLMPDVSSALIAELNSNKKDLYNEALEIGQNIKDNVFKSLTKASMAKESSVILKQRLSEINFVIPVATKVDADNYRNDVFDVKDSFPQKLLSLLKHFKKTLYSLDQKAVLDDSLLKYFVGAFETKPKTYPPSNLIAFQPGFLYEMSSKLPTYVKIAKVGLPLSIQISKHFTRNNFEKALNPQDAKIYESMENTFDTKYLMNKIHYPVEDVDFEFEDGNGNHLNYDDIFADNMGFRLDSDTFEEDKMLDHLPFLQDYSRAEAFITIALQGYCRKNTLIEFIGDYYDRRLPAPVKLRNIAKNSEFYAKTFNCTNDQFEKKQFPYINP